MKEIKLEIDKTIAGLAGSDYGEEIFNEQVKDKIDYTEPVKIVIPENIKIIAISFVQGFSIEIFKHITKEKFRDVFIIEGNDKVVKKFYEGIYF